MVNLVDKRRRLLTTVALTGAGFVMGVGAPGRALAAKSSKTPGQENELAQLRRFDRLDGSK